jgi:hypothetical protein
MGSELTGPQAISDEQRRREAAARAERQAIDRISGGVKRFGRVRRRLRSLRVYRLRWRCCSLLRTPGPSAVDA